VFDPSGAVVYNLGTVNPPAPQLTPAAAAANQRVPRRRWVIASLLGFGVLVNYFDRVNVSVSQDALHASFGITTVQFGYLLSAYSWSYALMQIPSGFLLDRFGVRKIGRISTLLWSAACFCSAGAFGIKSFFASRLLLGVGEAPTFPGSAKAVGYWFPRSERSLATAFFDAAAKLGPAVGVPLIGLLLLHYGWRWSFAATGIISFVYFLAFTLFYRNPSEDKRLTAAERQFIVAGGAHVEALRDATQPAKRKVPFAHMLRQKKVIGLVLGFGSYNYTFYLLLTWLPSYLTNSLGVDLRHSVLYTSIPWAVGTLTDFFVGGWLVNVLIHRGWDASRVRQTVLVVGTSLGLGIFGAAYAHTPAVAVFWISVSMGGLSAASPVGWSIPALIAPERGVGTLGGIMNSCNQLAAIVAPIVTGYIADRTHSFAWAFATAAAILVLGIAAYIFWLGRIEPIPDPA
jgi:ACS family D-galactonate transporter-like MFS transporter